MAVTPPFSAPAEPVDVSGVRVTVCVEMSEWPKGADAWTGFDGRGMMRDRREMGPYLLQMGGSNGMKSSSSGHREPDPRPAYDEQEDVVRVCAPPAPRDPCQCVQYQ